MTNLTILDVDHGIGKHLIIDYTNYKGERKLRNIEVECFFYGWSEFHPEGKSLFLCAMDLDKKQRRHFRVSDIHNWEEDRFVAHVIALRDRTGCGMAQCKKALEESGWSLDMATAWLKRQSKE